MMRLPIPVVLAALALVAAGTVLINIHVETGEPYVVINATGLRPGENITVVLDYIPHKIFVLSKDRNAYYAVFVFANATFKYPWQWWPFLSDGLYVHDVPSNGTAKVYVVDVRDTKTKIVVKRW